MEKEDRIYREWVRQAIQESQLLPLTASDNGPSPKSQVLKAETSSPQTYWARTKGRTI